MERFFSENNTAIERFERAIKRYRSENDRDKERIELIVTALETIRFHRGEYDKYAVVSVEKYGEGFLKLIGEEDLDSASLLRVLVWLGGFIREVSLYRDGRSSSEQAVLNYFTSLPEWSAEVFDGFYVDLVHDQLIFDVLTAAQRRAAVDIEEVLVISKESTAKISESRDEARLKIENLVDEYEEKLADLYAGRVSELSKLEERISEYKISLQKIASEYNFVALSHAFEGMAKEKRNEKWWGFGFVVALGVFSLAVPLLSVFVLPEILKDLLSSGWAPLAVLKLFGIVGLEILLLYFFRVSLKSYMLVRDQITDLKLRLSLCAFIEGYRDFVRDSGVDKVSAFQKFETLIFGQLPALDANLPGAIDGIEHISSVVKAIKR